MSITVLVGLEGALYAYVDVVGLVLGERVELDADLGQVQPRHFLVQVLGQGVDFVFVLVGVVPQLQLRQRLVGE